MSLVIWKRKVTWTKVCSLFGKLAIPLGSQSDGHWNVATIPSVQHYEPLERGMKKLLKVQSQFQEWENCMSVPNDMHAMYICHPNSRESLSIEKFPGCYRTIVDLPPLTKMSETQIRRCVKIPSKVVEHVEKQREIRHSLLLVPVQSFCLTLGNVWGVERVVEVLRGAHFGTETNLAWQSVLKARWTLP